MSDPVFDWYSFVKSSGAFSSFSGFSLVDAPVSIRVVTG